MATHQSVLTSTQIFFLSSEVVTMRQTDGTAHKLKPRSFHKSAHLQVHSCGLPPQCEPRLTNMKEVVAEFKRKISTEVRRQKKLDKAEKGELSGKYTTRMLYK